MTTHQTRGLARLARTWNAFGRTDPLWAILSRRDKKGGRWELDDFFATGRAEIDEALVHVARHVELTMDRALDFGSGVGRLAQALASHFRAVDGVDIAESMVERARQLNQHAARCNYHHNLRSDLSVFADGTFDFVYSNITLQHMPAAHAKAYIAEFFRVLKPGGAALFQLPVELRHRTPGPIQRALRCVYVAGKSLAGVPVMDMFGTSAREVREIIGAAGGRLLDIRENDAAGPDWTSHQYLAVRDLKT